MASSLSKENRISLSCWQVPEIQGDGKKSIWVNPANGHEILQEDGSKITLNFDKTSAECIVLINKIRASINATNDTLKAAASVDPLPLAEKIWQDLWAVSGATP